MPTGKYKRVKHWKLSEERKRQISETQKRLGNKPPSRKGIKSSEKQKKSSSEFMKGYNSLPRNRLGINSPNYRTGISKMTPLQKKEFRAGRKRPDNCEICETLGSELKYGLVYDHDHQTGFFRGWLCNQCNWALGNAKDNIEILEKMIKYLKGQNIKI